MTIQPGELDKRVVLLKRDTVTGELGNRTEGFSPAPNQPTSGVWAKVEWAAGGEAWSADANRRAATQRRRFTIRYRPDVAPTWRLRYDGEEYEILDVGELTTGGANEGRRRYLVIIAEALEVTAGPE